MQRTTPDTNLICFHCGDDCLEEVHAHDQVFCCHGCSSVYALLHDLSLDKYYELESTPGAKQKKLSAQWQDVLADEELRTKFLHFESENLCKAQFHVPHIHCSSCVYLLENLARLETGVQQASVDFRKKNVALDFDPKQTDLPQIAQKLATLGYAPDLTRKQQDKATNKTKRNNILRIGVAGFCFGNIMLMSMPDYLGLEGDLSTQYTDIFKYGNVIFVLPVLIYCAFPFYDRSWRSLREGFLNVDVPIVIGIAALTVRSAYDTFGLGLSGYWDSLAGLVFFLLLGRAFQDLAYSKLWFDRDYTSYFPIAVRRAVGDKTVLTKIEEIRPNDELHIRHGELVPADVLLMSDTAEIDYSFVSGESMPEQIAKGNKIFAGGRQVGAAIVVKALKKVDQSYLTSLWTNGQFKEDKIPATRNLTERISKIFTLAILIIAALTALVWWQRDTRMVFQTVTAVLIVACPCALALVVPFCYGKILGVLGKNGLYLKDTTVIDRLQEITDIIFDKTGTLTALDVQKIAFEGPPLDATTQEAVAELAAQNNHPLSRALAKFLPAINHKKIAQFELVEGQGVSGVMGDQNLKIGKADFVNNSTQNGIGNDTAVHVSVGQEYKGRFVFKNVYKKRVVSLLVELSAVFKLHLLSGDSDGERVFLSNYFAAENLTFNASPFQKLAYVNALKTNEKKPMMIGDGLNDAGALRNSHVGLAVVDDLSQFSPACDGILKGDQLPALQQYFKIIKGAGRLVKIGLIFSLTYNIIGLTFAVLGLLTPLVAAILMPISSISVVVLALVGTGRLSKRVFG